MSDIVEVEVAIRGVRPMLMHNGELCDPTNEFVRKLKQLTSLPAKRKTDATLEDMRRTEWEGGLYLDDEGRLALPADVVLASLEEGAKGQRKSKDASAAIFCDDEHFPLDYEGKLPSGKFEFDKFYDQKRFVHYKRAVLNGRTSIMRTRCRLYGWSCVYRVKVLTDIANWRDIEEWARYNGRRCGIGDWTPRYGRYEVESCKEVS